MRERTSWRSKPQYQAPINITAVFRAVSRTAPAQWVSDWPRSWYSSLIGGTLPGPVTQLGRAAAVDVHQLIARHCMVGLRPIQASHRPEPSAGLPTVRQSALPGYPLPPVHRGGGYGAPRPGRVSGADGHSAETHRHQQAHYGGGAERSDRRGPGGRIHH